MKFRDQVKQTKNLWESGRPDETIGPAFSSELLSSSQLLS